MSFGVVSELDTRFTAERVALAVTFAADIGA